MTLAASAIVFFIVLIAGASIGLRMVGAQSKPSGASSTCPKCGHGAEAARVCSHCGNDFSAPPAPPKAGKLNPFWPPVQDEASARLAAKQGMLAAFYCCGATLLAVALTHTGIMTIEGFTDWAIVDAVVFALLGVGIACMSRVAAVAALGMYLLERVWAVGHHGAAGNPALVIIGVTICFVNAIRGTFAFHNLSESRSSGVA